LARPAKGGAIDFSPNGVDYAVLAIGSSLGATIDNFGIGDRVDFEAVSYASTDKISLSGAVVSVKNSAGATVASFDVSGTYAAADFALSNDGAGHLLVSDVDPPVGGGRFADLLRRYDSAETHSHKVALDLLLPPVLDAETFTGALGHRYDRNGSDARGGWGVAAGSEDSTGHAPGPGS
jgi:hypothetical protein